MFRSALIAVSMIAALGCGAQNPNEIELVNVSYDPTRELYEEINQAFESEQKGLGHAVHVTQTHGGSGAQARAVIDGLKADVVTLGLAGDIDAIAKKGLLALDWERRLPNQSSPYTSTIVFVVRAGNPKGIHDWSDLVRPDVKVITPNPKTSGGARWNFLAAWGYVTVHQKKDTAEAKEFIRKLYRNVVKLDTGARGSTETFAKRHQGDVLISWENDAILAKKQVPEDKLEVVYPSVSILAEPPVAVVDTVVDARGTRAKAEEYLRFLYTDKAQEIIGNNHYRPTNAAILKQFESTLPSLPLFTLRDVAGDWERAHRTFFGDGGVFDEVYQPKGK